MELDLRMAVSIGTLLVSVVSAAVIVKTKLGTVIEQLADIEKRLRALDQRVDKSELTSARVDVLAKILDPEKRRLLFERLTKCEEGVKNAQSEIGHLRNMHNHKHPPVPNA
jgi:hypothetical protein